MMIVDTHAHLDGEEYRDDLDAVVERARKAGVGKVFVPAVDLKSVTARPPALHTTTVFDVCRRYPGYAYPMIGLHPEEVRADWREVLAAMRDVLYGQTALPRQEQSISIAIGEVGLDYYWSREYEREQLAAFEEQVQWSVETQLPLMIHCRKAQNELVSVLRRYERDLPGGVFHCFTGNATEAAQLLSFDRFVLGIGGVLTFKKATLPQTLAEAVPLDRIVLETDSPYMAPVPCRGQRNEPAFVVHVMHKLAEVYGVEPQTVADTTNATVHRIFHIGLS